MVMSYAGMDDGEPSWLEDSCRVSLPLPRSGGDGASVVASASTPGPIVHLMAGFVRGGSGAEEAEPKSFCSKQTSLRSDGRATRAVAVVKVGIVGTSSSGRA